MSTEDHIWALGARRLANEATAPVLFPVMLSKPERLVLTCVLAYPTTATGIFGGLFLQPYYILDYQ
ncbi:MAG: hypothetical protein JWR09_5017 [Mucilaginibacter sp.]|nr:hypothetical protein [Mucilaginibacter sp.]